MPVKEALSIDTFQDIAASLPDVEQVGNDLIALSEQPYASSTPKHPGSPFTKPGEGRPGRETRRPSTRPGSPYPRTPGSPLEQPEVSPDSEPPLGTEDKTGGISFEGFSEAQAGISTLLDINGGYTIFSKEDKKGTPITKPARRQEPGPGRAPGRDRPQPTRPIQPQRPPNNPPPTPPPTPPSGS